MLQFSETKKVLFLGPKIELMNYIKMVLHNTLDPSHIKRIFS